MFWIVIPIHGQAFVFDIEAIASKDEAHVDIRVIRHVRQFLEFCFEIWESFVELILDVNITSKTKGGELIPGASYQSTSQQDRPRPWGTKSLREGRHRIIGCYRYKEFRPTSWRKDQGCLHVNN